MCSHRPTGPWGRRWWAFLLATICGFAVLEGYGLATEGYPATLSAFLHRLGGQSEHCRHAHLSRLVIVGFFAWVVAHLGWGVLGWEPHHRHVCSERR